MSFSRLIVSVPPPAPSRPRPAPLNSPRCSRTTPSCSGTGPCRCGAAPRQASTSPCHSQRRGSVRRRGPTEAGSPSSCPFRQAPPGADLSVVGKGAVTVHDVLVGDVWLCSGESNMEFTLSGRPPFRDENAAAEVAAARFPLIRQFKVARQVAPAAADTVGGDWKACSSRDRRPVHRSRLFLREGAFCAFRRAGRPDRLHLCGVTDRGMDEPGRPRGRSGGYSVRSSIWRTGARGRTRVGPLRAVQRDDSSASARGAQGSPLVPGRE